MSLFHTPQPNPPDRAQFSQTAVLHDLEQLRASLHSEIGKFDQIELAEALQSEYAKLAVLIQRTERRVLQIQPPMAGPRQTQRLGELSNLVCSLRVSMAALLQNKPNLSLARQIRLDVEQELVRHEQGFPPTRFLINRFLYVWHSPSTPLKVIFGLICSFWVIFGGLFSLAILLYAIYAAGTANAELKQYKEVKQQEVALTKEMLRQESLNKQILAIKENKFTEEKLAKSTTEDPITASRLNELRKQLDQVNQKVQTLMQLQAEQRPQRAPAELTEVQQVLANFSDIGISKNLSQMLWVAAAGTLGSIVSILIRVIDEFHDKEYRDRLTPFFIGFFKPAIGASFGLLFLAFVNSGVVSTPLLATGKTANGTAAATPGNDTNNSAAFFLFATAFVVGFSERLAKDTITRLDGTTPKADGTVTPSPTPTSSRIVVIRPKRYITLHPLRTVGLEHRRLEQHSLKQHGLDAAPEQRSLTEGNPETPPPGQLPPADG